MNGNGLVTAKFATKGMFCTSCSMLIETVLSKIDGVKEVSSDYGREETTVTFDPTAVSVADILAGIEEAGYEGMFIG